MTTPYTAFIAVSHAKESSTGRFVREIRIEFGPEPIGKFWLLLQEDGTVFGKYTGSFQTAMLAAPTVAPGGSELKSEYQVWLRACLMEHEGRDQLVGKYPEEAAALEWIKAQETAYFKPGDYYIMRKDSRTQ